MRDKRKIYVVISPLEVKCYSNLTKAINNTPNITYSPIYQALKQSSRVEKNGYTIVCTVLN